MSPKMPGKLEEGDILLTYGVKNADGAGSPATQPDNNAARTTELTLKRLNVFGRQMEMLLEKPFQNVHECLSVITQTQS